MSWLKRMVLLGALGLAPALHAQVDDSESEAETEVVVPDSAALQALGVRLARLREAAQQTDSVRTAFEQAELAIERAREARQLGDEPRALRAEQIADAATTLAERRLALAREREAMRIARARLEDAHRSQGAAREALKLAQKRAAEAP